MVYICLDKTNQLRLDYVVCMYMHNSCMLVYVCVCVCGYTCFNSGVTDKVGFYDYNKFE